MWEGVTALLGWSFLFPSVSSVVLWGVTTAGRNQKEISRTQKSSIGPDQLDDGRSCVHSVAIFPSTWHYALS